MHCNRCSEAVIAKERLVTAQLPVVFVDSWAALPPNEAMARKTRLFDMAYSIMREEQPVARFCQGQDYSLYAVVCLVADEPARYVTYCFNAMDQSWTCYDGASCKVGLSPFRRLPCNTDKGAVHDVG